MEWKKYRLGDLACSIQTGPFGSQLHQSDYSSNGTPVIMPKDMMDGKISESSIARVADDHVERLKRHKVKSGDVVYSRRGDVGRCVLITDKEDGWLCGTGCLKVELDDQKVLPSFLFYILQRKDSVGWVENHAVGSTMPNLNTGILSKLPVMLPTLKEQQCIASILSAYDKLIEINNKRIRILEKMAENLYKEWFSYHKIYDDVKEVRISDIVSIHRGLSYSSEEINCTKGDDLINLKNIQTFGGFRLDGTKKYNGRTKPEQIVYEGDLVMGVTDMTQDRRTVGAVALIPNLSERSVISADLIKLVSDIDNVYLYAMFRWGNVSRYVSQFANGANVLHLKPQSLRNVRILLPRQDLIDGYVATVKPMINSINKLNVKNSNLARQRDLLLPRLMSGKLSISVD